MMRQHAELLERRTGQGVPEWRARITQQALKDEPALRSWLTSQGVEGYPQQLLVFETFGYPDFLTATADDLIDAQHADRPASPHPGPADRGGRGPGRARPDNRAGPEGLRHPAD